MNKGRFYIRKVTQPLMDKLNELGYEDCWTGYIHSQEVKDIILVFDGKWTLSGFIPYQVMVFTIVVQMKNFS